MRYVFKKTMAILMAISLVLMFVPASTFAADNEYVLTSLFYAPTQSAAEINGYNAVLTVPYGTDDPVDLSDGLDIDFNHSKYAAVHQPFFPDSPLAAIGGEPVMMEVEYQAIGSAEINSTTYYVRIREAEYTGPVFTGTLLKEVTLPTTTLSFSANDFTGLYTANDGGDLGSIVIKGSNPSFGSFRLNGAAYYFDDHISLADIAAGRLIFKATASGTASFSMEAYQQGNEDNPVGSATLRLTVKPESILVADINYNTDEDKTITLDSDDFNDVCQDVTGANLSYVKFSLPSASYGRLYYDYTSATNYGARVTATNKYYRSSSPDIDEITFVPYLNYNGTVTINYTGFSADGESYAGKVKITVKAISDTAATISYNTDEDEEIKFDSDDFNRVCADATGSNLSYVKFTLPSASYGRLYYRYVSASDYDSRVTAATKYYRSAAPDLDEVTFVPYPNYRGIVTILYTGLSAGNESYSGKIRIEVGAGTTATTISYKTSLNTKLTLDSDDFNRVCNNVTGENLSYVKFSLPSATYGRLYYRYVSASNYDSRVTATIKYYRSSVPDLDYVSFVPASGYDGTVTIDYTGYSTGGESYAGKVRIVIERAQISASTINYTIQEGSRIIFDSDDFNDVCRDVTGNSLYYVKFTLPSTNYGRLYYRYVSASNMGTRVAASTRFYRNTSPDLDYVSFVPAAGFYGKVTITYTGFSIEEQSFTGKIVIAVSPSMTADVSKYFVDVNANYTWAAPYIDYLYEEKVVEGTGLGRYSPAEPVTRGDFMLMLYKALDLSAGSAGGNFPDVPRGSYYYQAIATAKALGIAQGSNGYFWPNSAITREESMALVARALKVKGIMVPAGDRNTLAGFYDHNEISDYAKNAVTSLVAADVISGFRNYIFPLNTTTRAEMAVILYRVMHL